MRLTLKDIAMTIWRSIVLIIIVSLVGGTLFAVSTCLFIKPKYTATAKLYVYNEKTVETVISSSDLQVSKSLVDTYLIIIKSEPVLGQVQKDLSYKYPELTTKDILEMISGSAINETEAFYISAKSEDRQLAKDIIDDILEVAPEKIISVVKAASVEIIERAQLPEEDDYEWPIVSNTIIGFAIGLVLSIAYVLLSNALDSTIYGKNEIEQNFNIPIVGSIPLQGSYSFGKNKNKNQNLEIAKVSSIISKSTPFAIIEAYKKARSNIVYLPGNEDNSCKTLAITSGFASEGKTTFSINLALSLAQTGNKVLLIDADMRKPKVSTYLNLEKQNGLSEYLAKLSDIFEPKIIAGNFSVIVSGEVNSYAAELLSTERAKELFKKLKKEYEYIIVDLPPINEVSDPMTVASSVDGYIMCAFAGYSDTKETKNAISSLEQIGAKILGFVLLGVEEEFEQYGRYKRYGKYYAYRYSGYYRRKYGNYYKYYNSKEKNN